MASTLRRLKIRSVGTAPVQLATDAAQTTPSISTVWNIPRLYITNIHASATPTVTVTHTTSSQSTNIAVYKLGAKSSSTGSLILENIVLLNGDTVEITSDTAASIDAFASVIEENA